jgi:hypothetical protein
LASPTVLCECGTWAIREQAKYSITSAGMKCIRIMTKYRWQNYKTIEDILSELKINPVVKKCKIT